MEGRLTFEKHLGGFLTLAVLLASGYLAWQRRQQAGWRAVLAPRLPLLAVWCIVSPYLLMVAERVRAPECTLLYKSQYFFLLAVLLLERLRAQPGWVAWYRRYGRVLGGWLLLSVWLLVQLELLYRHQAMIRSYGTRPVATPPACFPFTIPTYH